MKWRLFGSIIIGISVFGGILPSQVRAGPPPVQTFSNCYCGNSVCPAGTDADGFGSQLLCVLSCGTLGGISCSSTPPPPSNIETCAGATLGFCPFGSGISCPRGYVIGYYSYDCPNVCCAPVRCGDVKGLCVDFVKTRGQCPNGYTYDPSANYNLDESCGFSNDKYCCQPESNFVACTQGFSNCGGFGGNYNAPANSCWGGNGLHNRTCTHDQNQPCNPTNFTDVQSTTYDNCNHAVGYACTGGTCTTTIFVHVYVDYAHNGSNNGPYALQQAHVSDNGGNNPTTDINGNVQFTAKAVGPYHITLTVPPGYVA